MAFPMNAPQAAPVQQEGVQGKPPMRPAIHGGAMKAASMFRKGPGKKKAPLPAAPPPSAAQGSGGW